MEDLSINEAQLLWNDACSALPSSASEQLHKMTHACVALSLDNQILTISAPSSFVAHMLEQEKILLEETLETCAFKKNISHYSTKGTRSI